MTKKINISEEKCTKCNLCVEVCPKLIFVRQEKNIPQIENEEKCIECGHCLAICPVDAIIYPEISKARVTDKITSQNIDIKSFLGSLRSVRKYKDKPVDEQLLNELIDIASLAPSASNGRKDYCMIIQNTDKISQLEETVIEHFRSMVRTFNPFIQYILKVLSKPTYSYVNKIVPSFKDLINKYENGLNPVFHKAPVLILFIGQKVNHMSKDDTDAKLHYFRMAAHAKGLGSCIIGYAINAHKAVEKKLKIDKKYQVFGAVILGYPKNKYSKIIFRNSHIVLD